MARKLIINGGAIRPTGLLFVYIPAFPSICYDGLDAGLLISMRFQVLYYIRQRSWANVMYSSPFVCLSVCLFVCLFVCLLAGLLKKLWTDLNEI